MARQTQPQPPLTSSLVIQCVLSNVFNWQVGKVLKSQGTSGKFRTIRKTLSQLHGFQSERNPSVFWCTYDARSCTCPTSPNEILEPNWWWRQRQQLHQPLRRSKCNLLLPSLQTVVRGPKPGGEGYAKEGGGSELEGWRLFGFDTDSLDQRLDLRTKHQCWRKNPTFPRPSPRKTLHYLQVRGLQIPLWRFV